MALIDASELVCLVCHSSIDLNSLINIFYTPLPHNGEILANFILKVLKVSTSDLFSSYVCLRCYNLFGMLEQAQYTATNIQCEILKIFQTSSNAKLLINSSLGIDSQINEVTDSFKDADKLDQIDKSKLLITEYLTEKDLNSLKTIISQPSSNVPVISNDIATKPSNEAFIIYINNIEEPQVINYTTNKQSVENKVPNQFPSLETANLKENIPIFTNEILKAPSVVDTMDQNGFDWQNVENSSNFNIQANQSINKVPESLQTQTEETSEAIVVNEEVESLDELEMPPTCESCGQQCMSEAELRVHLLNAHPTLRPYACKRCGRTYKHKRALDIHVGLHNGVSPYRCVDCGKCFTQKGALQRHLPLHTGETPYQCELCGKRFVHHTSYNMHALSHSGKKSYQCHVCDLSLLSTSHLKRHMRMHTGEKPYSCTVCGKKFAERYNLQAHQKIHDPAQVAAKEAKKNQHKCSDCGAAFKTKSKLVEHIKTHNSDKKIVKSSSPAIEPDNSNSKKAQPLNGADLLENCVNEVWQSLSRKVEVK